MKHLRTATPHDTFSAHAAEPLRLPALSQPLSHARSSLLDASLVHAAERVTAARARTDTRKTSRADVSALVPLRRECARVENMHRRAAFGRQRSSTQAPSPKDAQPVRPARATIDLEHALDRFSFALMACALWAMFRFMLGEVMAPHGPATEIGGGAVWAVAIIWACAHIGGACANAVGLPSLIGMLLMGLFLRNVPGKLVDDLPESWSSDIRAAGLSVILLRSGLELDLPAFKSVGWMAARLTVMPGVSEAVTCGLFSMLIFKMSFPLGMCLGFILAAVSPAVVVLGMFELQSRGYGVAKGIPSLVVAAASFDDVVAITGYTVFKSFALGGHGNMAWTVLHGPVDVITGLVAGAAGGAMLGMTIVLNERWKRSAMTFMLGMFFMFIGREYHFSGGGAMASLALGISANKFWASGGPYEVLSSGPSVDHAHNVEVDLAKLWRFIFQPLLFGVIGSAVNFKDITLSTIPKSLGLLAIGLTIRLSVAFFAVGGGKKPLVFRERLFVALSWIPKATVQAALASDPLDYILDKGKSAEYVRWGNDILSTAVFSIILTAPVGMMIISALGPKWLQKDEKGALIDRVEPFEDIIEAVDRERRTSIEIAVKETIAGTEEGRPSLDEYVRRSSLGGGSVRSLEQFMEESSAVKSFRDREGSVIGSVLSEADSQTALKGVSASDKVVFYLATLRELASDSPNIAPEELQIIQDASDAIEEIMREHLPRTRQVDTPGLFFRRTSATAAQLDLPSAEDLEAEIVAEVIATPGDTPRKPEDGDDVV